MLDLVSPGPIFDDLSDSGNDAPVPISLPGRAPLFGSTAGGSPCAQAGVVSAASTIRPTISRPIIRIARVPPSGFHHQHRHAT
jgi:hypothetical protein